MVCKKVLIYVWKWRKLLEAPQKVLWSNLSFEHLDNGHFLEVVTNRERDLDLHFNYAWR